MNKNKWLKRSLLACALVVGGAAAHATAPDPATITTGMSALYEGGTALGIEVITVGLGIAFVLKGVLLKKK
jgi:hypothetical protein